MHAVSLKSVRQIVDLTSPESPSLSQALSPNSLGDFEWSDILDDADNHDSGYNLHSFVEASYNQSSSSHE